MKAKTEAEHFLRELPYEQWLTTGRMMVPKGIHISRISNLEELEWTMRPTAKTLVAMRFDNLEKWLRESIGDNYFADEVKKIREKEGISYVECSKLIHEAILSRVTHLKNISQGVNDV